jgi:hypothetical protein
LLRLGPYVVKEFRVPAPNQELVLTAFQELGWPAHIDDPLPPVPNIEPKLRLHDTINRLNKNQRHKLLHFHSDGTGRGLRWEALEPEAAGAAHDATVGFARGAGDSPPRPVR